MYAVINDREEGSCMHDNEKTPPIDSATGMYTTIYFQDFTAMIDQNPDDIPVEAESDGNKYFHFVYRMLLACESGSCGGDACRLYEILRAGLDGLYNIPTLHLNSPSNTCWDGRPRQVLMDCTNSSTAVSQP